MLDRAGRSGQRLPAWSRAAAVATLAGVVPAKLPRPLTAYHRSAARETAGTQARSAIPSVVPRKHYNPPVVGPGLINVSGFSPGLVTITTLAEPASLVMLPLGPAGVAAVVRRRRRAV
jgi:hypothetical protein